MNFKKTKVAVASGLMAASMVLAPLAAYADTNKDDSFTSASIQKTVKVADGVTIKGNIHFSVEQVPNQGENATVAPNEENGEFTAITGLKMDYKVETNNKTNASDEKARGSTHQATDFTYVESVGLNFSALTIPGEYTFVVKELETGDNQTILEKYTADTSKGWTFSTNQYLVRVYVKNNNGHTKEYTIQKGTYDRENKKWTADATDPSKKNVAAFENTYQTYGNVEGSDDSLKITKKVTANDYVDPNEKFDFTIVFEADQGSPATVPETITPKESTTYSWEKVTTEGVENTYTFKLKANETLEFEKLPAGIHYTVTESEFTNKKSTTNVATSNNIGTQNNNETTGKQLIGEKENSAEFTNTFKNITITGVVTHSAPFVIMVGALFVAVGGYVVLKKRIEE